VKTNLIELIKNPDTVLILKHFRKTVV